MVPGVQKVMWLSISLGRCGRAGPVAAWRGVARARCGAPRTARMACLLRPGSSSTATCRLPLHAHKAGRPLQALALDGALASGKSIATDGGYNVPARVLLLPPRNERRTDLAWAVRVPGACCTRYSLCDVFAVQLAQDADLLLNVIDLVLCILEVDDLDCHGMSVGLVVAAVYLAAGKGGEEGAEGGKVVSFSSSCSLPSTSGGAHNSPKASLANPLLLGVVVLWVGALGRGQLLPLRAGLCEIVVGHHAERRLTAPDGRVGLEGFVLEKRMRM